MRPKFLEHILDGNSVQNALPVALIVYTHTLDRSKPFYDRHTQSRPSDPTDSTLHNSRYNSR